MAQVSQMRKLLASGWECHDSESERVATELEGATGDELSPEDLRRSFTSRCIPSRNTCVTGRAPSG